MYLVFTQSKDGRFDFELLRQHAQSFFDAQILPLDSEDEEVRLSFRTHRGALEASFLVRSRAVNEDDQRAIRQAEVMGNAAGMGVLASRCKHVWEVHPLNDPSERSIYLFCAALATVALGPILPPDHATLLGVRSARALGQKEDAYR